MMESKSKTVLSLLFGLSVILYGRNNSNHFFNRISNLVGEGNENSKVVETNYGKLEGFLSYSRDGRPFWEFLGIPYASPPVKELRFKDPVPPKHWNGVRSARYYGSKCIQFDMFIEILAGDEDCLFLNVFTTNIPKKQMAGSELLPVIVVFHGGHYMYGSGEEYRPEYFMDEGVILVTFNYRLGALGFLSTGDDVVTGNMGLKDQVMALKWVNENIQNFGGNPERVTLLGHSAGSASVHMHMLSKQSKGLFHGVIGMSGNALAPWAIKKNPWRQAERLGNQVNCPTNSSQDLLNCLMAIDSYALAQVHSEIVNILATRSTLYSPWVEVFKNGKEFFSESPEDSIRHGRLQSKVPLMTGVNSDEGLIFVIGIRSSKPDVEYRFIKNWKKYFPTFLYLEDLSPEIGLELAKSAKDYFIGNKTAVSSAIKEISRMISTVYFFEPMRRCVAFHTQHHPVYLYHYEHKGSSGFYQMYNTMTGLLSRLIDWPLALGIRWLNANIKLWDDHFFGACHGDENLLLFKVPILTLDVQESDTPMSRQVVKSWAAFATNGEPGSFNSFQWTPVKQNDTSGFDYMIIGENAGMREEPFKEHADFWSNELSKARVAQENIQKLISLNLTCHDQCQSVTRLIGHPSSKYLYSVEFTNFLKNC